jgi:hypothetical protein
VSAIESGASGDLYKFDQMKVAQRTPYNSQCLDTGPIL